MAIFRNEADGKQAQPRFSFFSPVGRHLGQPGRWRRVAWRCAVPFAALLLIVFGMKIGPEVHDAPPTLQTLERSRAVVVANTAARSRPKESVATKLMPEPQIRVNVTPGGVDSLDLQVRGSFRWTSLEPNKKLPPPPDLSHVKVSGTKAGLVLGSQRLAVSQLEIEPEQSPSIRVNGHLYRGKMRLFRRTDGKISAVNVLPIEEYLSSVVDSEMPAKFPEAARQAQAIVARTYALYQSEQADPSAVYDLLSSQRSQKYLGVEYLDPNGRRLAGESESSRRAVRATHATVCQRRGELFCTYYSAVCGGCTTDGSELFKDAVDLVRSVPCEWCRDSPHYRWKSEMSLAEFQTRIADQESTRKPRTLRTIRQKSGPGGGLISRFEIDDAQRIQLVSGVELRERLPTGKVFSPHFRMTLESDRVVFDGRGHGHGAGFCQWGAKGQAEAGRSHLDIVRHYYPGVEIKVLDY